jgi:hypothetical protein
LGWSSTLYRSRKRQQDKERQEKENSNDPDFGRFYSHDHFPFAKNNGLKQTQPLCRGNKVDVCLEFRSFGNWLNPYD